MTVHRTLNRTIRAEPKAKPHRLIGEIAVAPLSTDALSPRWRIAVIVAGSAWLWMALATIAGFVIG